MADPGMGVAIGKIPGERREYGGRGSETPETLGLPGGFGSCKPGAAGIVEKVPQALVAAETT